MNRSQPDRTPPTSQTEHRTFAHPRLSDHQELS